MALMDKTGIGDKGAKVKGERAGSSHVDPDRGKQG